MHSYDSWKLVNFDWSYALCQGTYGTLVMLMVVTRKML